VGNSNSQIIIDMNIFPQFSASFFALLLSALLLTSGSGCYVMYDLAGAALTGKDESYTITDQVHFLGDRPTAYYKDLLDEVGGEMGFKVSSESPEGFVWVAEESKLLDSYFLGKYKGTAVSAVISPAVGEDYQPIPQHKTLHLSLSSAGNYRSVSREQVKPMFEEVKKRFIERM
jgi:hypothetical protein